MLNTEELLNVIVNALDDVKAKDIVVFDTTGKTSAFTRVVVCSGTSNRQTRALGMSVSRAVREAGGKVSGLEGSDTGEWVLVDCGEVVVHCMQPAMRSYYNLEETKRRTQKVKEILREKNLDPNRARTNHARYWHRRKNSVFQTAPRKHCRRVQRCPHQCGMPKSCDCLSQCFLRSLCLP